MLARIQAESLIEPFDESRIDCAAYTLSMGGHAYTSGDSDQRKQAFEKGKTPGDLKIGPGEKVTIQPGQFAFLLTAEKVTIPHDAVGFISVKATHKYAGLINVSGFHVDPGWSSPLIFAVFNAGPRELIFERGQPLFLIFMASLDQLSDKVKKDKKNFGHIPAEFIAKMAGEVPSLFKINKTTKDLENKVQESIWKVAVANGLATLALGFAITSGGILFSKLVLPAQQAPSSVVSQDENTSAKGSPISTPSIPTSIKPKANAGSVVETNAHAADSSPSADSAQQPITNNQQ